MKKGKGTGQIIRSKGVGGSMYESIDIVCGKVKRKLRKFKEKVVEGGRRKDKMGRVLDGGGDFEEDDGVIGEMLVDEEKVGIVENEEELEEMDREFSSSSSSSSSSSGDEEVINNKMVVKRKVFQMPKQSVETAVDCLEYIDHDFYLFRNEDSGEINLVYKRNHGGVGLITPQDPNAVED